jgi:transmembrane sensor
MKQLFHKFLNDECTSVEVEQLIEYIRTKGSYEDLPGVEEVLSSQKTYQRIGEKEADQLFNTILGRGPMEVKKNHTRKTALYGKVAATIAFFFIATSLALLLFQGKDHIHKTAYGEVRSILLPDGSSVILNGNSMLTYQGNWDAKSERIVKIEGEAFFSVVHTKTHQRFIVQTDDEFSIEVLGTKFNVLHRRGKAEVVLNEGKVKVNVRKNDSLQHITMKPGESVAYEKNTKAVERIKVKAENKSSWKNSKLVLDNTSMAEVIGRIEETYGVTIQVDDPKLLELKLWGTVPCYSLDNLLKGIETSFNLRMSKKGNHITITKAPI